MISPSDFIVTVKMPTRPVPTEEEIRRKILANIFMKTPWFKWIEMEVAKKKALHYSWRFEGF